MTLMLRVSGKHLPRIKTINEAAIMKYVKRNTTISIPAVVRFHDDHEAVEKLGLNESRIVMAHGELHLGNIMCRPLNGFITGIIDWEFAGTVPAWR